MTASRGDPPSAVAFDGVSLMRGSVRALDKVTVRMPGGQTTAVLGASGSGKSTLVQLAMGLLRPNTGSISVLGEAIDYANLRPLRRRIGYALQDVALLPHLSVEANIRLPAVLTDRDAAETAARLEELLAMMELPSDVLRRYPHELSGGQQQRAGLCRAMMLRPELLLLDEPFSGLDALTRQGIHERFLELRRQEPISAILVTHEPQEAVNLADYLIVMQDGRVLQCGPVEAVIAAPVDDYVRKLCTGLAGVAT
ncbi:MAG: ATP-binding cassette domain-containing protein [Pseudomonadota bacterium]